MRYTDQEKESFENRLALVKERLKAPQFKSYGAVLRALNPELESRQIYNVVHCNIKNMPILEALEKLVGIEQAVAVA